MLLLLLLTFFGVTLGILATGFVWSEIRRRDEIRAIRRLDEELNKPKVEEESSERLFKSMSELELGERTLPFDDLTPYPPVPPVGSEFAAPSPVANSPPFPARLNLAGRVRDTLLQSDLKLTPRLFLAVSAAAALVLGVAGYFLMGWFLAVPAVVVGGLAPWFYVRHRAHGRQDKLLRQMAPAFDLMARVLRAGLSMPQAFQSVAEAFESPISGEFARCKEEQNLGVFPEVSFRGMADRTGVLEMKIFVMAMLIQRQTGGNLSEVLERLAGLMRERLRLRRHIRTLTAEGRLQAVILLVLPFVMFLAMRVINKPYTDVLLAHPEWLAATGCLMAAGAFWIRKVIDIE